VADITDAYAEPPLPSEKKAVNFVTLWGLARFSAYLVDHRAEKAVLLLLAIQRRMDVKHKTKVALTSDVWKDAGDPSRTARETILAHLRRMPELVTLHEVRRVASRYRVEKGPMWLQIEKAGRDGVEEEEEEEEGEGED